MYVHKRAFHNDTIQIIHASLPVDEEGRQGWYEVYAAFKSRFHLKINNLSSFTHHYVFLNSHDFLSSMEQKRRNPSFPFNFNESGQELSSFKKAAKAPI